MGQVSESRGHLGHLKGMQIKSDRVQHRVLQTMGT